jgi:4-hydroxy-tetrahydrodipicolinate synthase
MWTALVTPFLQGVVDFDSFKILLHQQEAAGNGIVLFGSTGEGLALEDDEKKEMLLFALKHVSRVPIMAGVGGFNLRLTKEWLSFCDTLPIHSYLMPVPLYAKPGIEGQIHWFKSLMDHVSKPCMIYNLPSRAGIRLFPEVLQALAEHPNCWALKDSSGSVLEFTAYKNHAPHLEIYSGDDLMMPAFAPLGAKGLVSVASNIWPEATKHYAKACFQDTPSIAPWEEVIESLFETSNPIPAKALLHDLGVISSCEARPPLSPKDLSSLHNLRKSHVLVTQWMKENYK